MPRYASILIVTLLLGGCYNYDKSTDGRSALEQQLTRTAIARAIDKLAIHKRVLEGTWKIEVVAPYRWDMSWIRAYLRRRLATLGAKISRDQNADLPIVEVGVVVAGSDVDNFYVGIPVPGTGSILGFINSITEKGRARMALAFWNEQNELIGETPVTEGSAYYKSTWYLTLFGPFGYTDMDIKTSGRFGDIAKENWTQVREAGDWILPKKPPKVETDQ